MPHPRSVSHQVIGFIESQTLLPRVEYAPSYAVVTWSTSPLHALNAAWFLVFPGDYMIPGTCVETLARFKALSQSLELQRWHPTCLLGSLGKKTADSLKVALMRPEHGKGGEEKCRRGEGLGSDQGGADRHLINSAQCPCYGQVYSTGSCACRQTVL